jgi:ABC-type transport system involved in multi-copper enzyme maturation permease subunit
MTAGAVSRAAGTSRTASTRAGFGRLLRAEWVKFRSVRGWVIGMIVAAVLAILMGVFAGGSASIACGSGNGVVQATGRACLPYVPLGPGGEAVTDSFYLVSQPLAGNGTITVRVTALTGRHAEGNGPAQAQAGSQNQGPAMVPGLVPWAKAGLIVKASTKQGAAYAAMMVTGGHGVRMQDNFTRDTAGLAGAVSPSSPRWLRLTRSGDTVTGYDSTDGTHWTQVGTAVLAALPQTAQVGMFATAPAYLKLTQITGGDNIQTGPSVATASFSQLRLAGGWRAGGWTGLDLGNGIRADANQVDGSYHQAAGVFTVSGSGDIAPVVPGPAAGLPSATIEDGLAGLFAGLIAVLVVAALFVTAEYRRGLIRVTLAASPNRGAVLAAKSVVAGAVAFVVGLVASVICIWLTVPRQRKEGLYVLPVPAMTEVRVVVGTAAMVAVIAVFAVALGTIFRRSAAAITAGIVAIVLPFLLAVTVLPSAAASWVLRVSPAAGFAIEQSIPHYSQVIQYYAAGSGSYPLTPAAGFAVLCAWTAAALLLAGLLLRRRDA